MDVNRAQTIAALNSYTGGNQQHHQNDGKQRDKRPPDEAEPIVEVDGVAADVTPAVQAMLDNLAAELEPLRAQLLLAEERERQLRDDLAQHAFLPVPGRREFLRELNHVLNHLDDLTDPPHLALLHVADADEVRTKWGRRALDRYLVAMSDEITRRKLPTDVLGNLGGNDFALIMLDDTGSLSDIRLNGIVESLSQMTIALGDGDVQPVIRAGLAEIRPGMATEALIEAADRSPVSKP